MHRISRLHKTTSEQLKVEGIIQIQARLGLWDHFKVNRPNDKNMDEIQAPESHS